MMTKQIVVEYDPVNGWTCPDGQVEEYLDWIVSCYRSDRDSRTIIHEVIGSEIIIHEYRRRIHRKEIRHNSIRFTYKEHTIYPDENGRLNHWPEGF